MNCAATAERRSTREKVRSSVNTLVIGQRDRIALPSSPRRWTRVVDERDVQVQRVGEALERILAVEGPQHFLQRDHVGAELGDHEAGARGVGSRSRR